MRVLGVAAGICYQKSQDCLSFREHDSQSGKTNDRVTMQHRKRDYAGQATYNDSKRVQNRQETFEERRELCHSAFATDWIMNLTWDRELARPESSR